MNWKQIAVICAGIVAAPVLSLLICVHNAQEIPIDQPPNGKIIILIHSDERVFYVICGIIVLVVGIAVKYLATKKVS